MKLSNLLLSVGVGFSCGYLAAKTIEKTNKMTPERALQSVKSHLAEKGKIESSWIIMTPEKYPKNGLTYNVYRCGITLQEGEEYKQCEVLCDTGSGVIIDIIQA